MRNRNPLLSCLAVLLATACNTSASGATPPSNAINEKVRSAKMSNWTRPPEAELRKRLSKLSWEVTQNDATEPPFRNAYFNNKEKGLYVDIVSGEPLFASTHKFDSGSGWPSFTQPIEDGRVVSKKDVSHGMVRTEVRSAAGDSHLGHVFNDGPAPTHVRYCINSASLRFVPVEKLAEEGYGDYLPHFGKAAAPLPANTANACAQPEKASSGTMSEGPGCQTSLETAILAGGCFWGMEEILRGVDGVLETEVGYTGGETSDPKYTQVKTGRTGHAEAIRIVFDPSKISFAKLLEDWFFRMHDPTTKNRQGNDVGSQYRSAIFATSDDQAKAAREVIARVDASGKWARPIVTEIATAGEWTPAEGYHQDYLQKNPGGYTCHYMRD